MIAKFSRGMIAFIVRSLVFDDDLDSFSYLYASGKKNWLLEVFQIKLFFIPIIFIY